MARRAQSLARALAVIFALLAGVSCRQILEIEPRPVYRDAVELTVCGLPTAGPTAACGQCMTEACCDAAQLCADAQGCPDLEACFRNCASGDAVCQRECYGVMIAVIPVQQDVETCRASSCGTECRSGAWECLGNVKWSPRTGAIPPTITINTAVDDGAGTPIVGARVRVCSMADPNCLVPLATGTTDSAGETALVVDTFDHVPPLAVFLDYHKEGFQDLLMHFNSPPIVQTPPYAPASSRVNFDGVAVALQNDGHWSDGATGTTYDPTRGQVILNLWDCNGWFASGVAVTWLDRDEQAKTFYPDNGGPLAVNLPINPATGITRVLVSEIGSGRLVATANVVVRPNTLSFAGIHPTP